MASSSGQRRSGWRAGWAGRLGRWTAAGRAWDGHWPSGRPFCAATTAAGQALCRRRAHPGGLSRRRAAAEVSMRAGLKGGRGAGGCQPNSAWAAAPHTRPWQAPMPQRLAIWPGSSPGDRLPPIAARPRSGRSGCPGPGPGSSPHRRGRRRHSARGRSHCQRWRCDHRRCAASARRPPRDRRWRLPPGPSRCRRSRCISPAA